MENILQNFQLRTSCKNFDIKKKVTKEDIDEIIECFRMSPSMMNIQPWKMFIIENPMTKLKLKVASGNQSQVAKNSHYIVFARRKDFDNNFLEDIAPNNFIRQEKILNFLDNFSEEEQKNWAISQVSVALGCVISFLALKQIDACAIGVINREKYDEILGLSDKWYASVFGLAIGYAEEKINSKNRLSTDKIVEFL